MERILSQEEIDQVFRRLRSPDGLDPKDSKAELYDFRRPDRIAKEQLRAIHMLHENFSRSLASSLSAYLRAYVMVTLISVEQLSFAEFLQILPSPTIVTALTMKPYEGSAVLEMNPSLVFPILEMLLGGAGKGSTRVDREITEIEASILESVYRIILQDLKEAWHTVAPLSFTIEARETEPQMLQILAPNEAIVGISMEVRIGENSGMLNLGIPSITVKMLRQKFDQQWSLRRKESSEQEQARILRLIRPAKMHFDVRLKGPTITAQDLLRLEEDDVLVLDYPIDRPLALEINGQHKWDGQIVDNGRKRAFLIEKLISPEE